MINKNIIIILVLIICAFIFCTFLFNINISKSIEAILEVDSEKNMSLKFTSSNISLISDEKSLSITLEGKIYFINDIELTYIGNSVYIINFSNDELYKLIKTNSIYNVNIVYGSKKIFETIFNI